MGERKKERERERERERGRERERKRERERDYTKEYLMFRYSTISWSQFSTKKSLARASREPRSAEKSSNEDYFKFGGEGDGKGGRGPLTRQQLEKQILCLTIILTLIFFTSAPMQ